MSKTPKKFRKSKSVVAFEYESLWKYLCRRFPTERTFRRIKNARRYARKQAASRSVAQVTLAFYPKGKLKTTFVEKAKISFVDAQTGERVRLHELLNIHEISFVPYPADELSFLRRPASELDFFIPPTRYESQMPFPRMIVGKARQHSEDEEIKFERMSWKPFAEQNVSDEIVKQTLEQSEKHFSQFMSRYLLGDFSTTQTGENEFTHTTATNYVNADEKAVEPLTLEKMTELVKDFRQRFPFVAFTVNQAGYHKLITDERVRELERFSDATNPFRLPNIPLAGLDVHIVENQKEDFLEWRDKTALNYYLERMKELREENSTDKIRVETLTQFEPDSEVKSSRTFVELIKVSNEERDETELRERLDKQIAETRKRDAERGEKS